MRVPIHHGRLDWSLVGKLWGFCKYGHIANEILYVCARAIIIVEDGQATLGNGTTKPVGLRLPSL